MAMVNEIKVINFNGTEVERQITLNLVRKIAGGMEAAGDVFSPMGEKTGFYRYQNRYEYPVFFNNKGRRFYGGNPINAAIKEVVHAWAVSVNSKRKEVKEAATAAKNTAYQTVRKEALAVLAANKEQSIEKAAVQDKKDLLRDLFYYSRRFHKENESDEIFAYFHSLPDYDQAKNACNDAGIAPDIVSSANEFGEDSAELDEDDEKGEETIEKEFEAWLSKLKL